MRSIGTIALLLALVLGSTARAQQAPPPGSELTVTLVTFGHGTTVFERFGHNALWFHDARAGTDVAYQWGLFDFDDPGLIVRFLTGDTRYWMGPQDAPQLIEHSLQRGRPVTLQRLDLTPARRARLLAFARWNALEENRYYRYDYFRDNCSTRLRDALDMATDGALRRQYDTTRTALTYRGESVRLAESDGLLATGIDIALGRPADAPLTAWQSFFVPMRLRDAMRTVPVAGVDGAPTPLVADERTLAPPPGAHQDAEATTVPGRTVGYLLWGSILAVGMVLLRRVARARPRAASGLALLGATWSLLCGVLGVILLLAWFTTRHVFWAANENVLLLSPLSLALVPLVPAALLRGRWFLGARLVATVVAVLSLVALLLTIALGREQSRVVALFLPVHLALAWVLARPRAVRLTPPAAR